MLVHNAGFAGRAGVSCATGEARHRVLELLCRRYLREKQHVMRFRQHADRIADDEIRRELLCIAAKEEDHVRAIEDRIADLRGQLPRVIEIHCGRENAWAYLRSDLDEERRCIAEIEEDKIGIEGEFPEVAGLLERIETDAKKHREEIRALLSDERRPLWAA